MTRIGTMNLLSFVTPVFQPARLADSKVGVKATKFMGSLLDLAITPQDQEPTWLAEPKRQRTGAVQDLAGDRGR